MLEEHAGALGLVRIIWRLHKKVIADLVVQYEADQVSCGNGYLHSFDIPVELEFIEDLPGSLHVVGETTTVIHAAGGRRGGRYGDVFKDNNEVIAELPTKQKIK